MRRDVLDLRAFYAQPLGGTARRMLGRKLAEAWGDAAGLDLLGLGYATPWMDQFAAARRAVAAMPYGQGADRWPAGARNRVALVDDEALPFANACFDRILLVHGLEESEAPGALLDEACRVLMPAGRIIVVAAARAGLWSHAEKTPFGHGRPFTRGQLENLVREAGLEPAAWSQALYVPPFNWLTDAADGFEQVGSRLWPAAGGLVLLEAVKQVFAPRARAARARVARVAPQGLAPAPAGLTPSSPLKSRRERS